MLQIIGTPSSRETQKAVRYCKERRIPFQLLDISQKELSEREWASVFSSVTDISTLIDKDSKIYKSKGYAYMEFDVETELKENPSLLLLPILRCKGKAHSGFDASFIEATR